MSRHGSTLCSPTVEKILCRSPISQRSHVVNLRQTLPKGSGDEKVDAVMRNQQPDEVFLDKCAFVIENNTTLDAVREQLKKKLV